MYGVLPIAAALLSTATSFVLYPEAFLQQAAPALPSKVHALPKPLEDTDDTPLPVVIWHGLGDSSSADGLKDIASLIDSIHPGTYTHIVSIGADGNADRTASFYGNLTEQVEIVCAQLKKDPIVSTAPAIDALGFSQGGQFLRGYVEKCNDPPVRNLLTFGSQHNGISEIQKCKSALDLLCQGASALIRSGGIWSAYIQSRLVPAQYYRNPADLENYLASSAWLADINNERKVKNATYARHLASLEKFVMVLFDEDKTVIPKESGWFAEVNVTSDEVTALRNRTIYEEDWIGLKALDKKGGLVFEKVHGDHMQLDPKDLKRLFGKYFGPMKAKDEAWESREGVWHKVSDQWIGSAEWYLEQSSKNDL